MALELQQNGATGSYERELRDLEEKLAKIREILESSQGDFRDQADAKWIVIR
jgi:hypothetical protein